MNKILKILRVALYKEMPGSSEYAPLQKDKLSKPQMVWHNIAFFAITTVGAVVGAPIYLYHYGISGPEIALFLFYVMATGMSITVGYHRLFAHVNYKAHPVVQFLLLFFGAAAFEQSALRWAVQHRDHHRFVDTEHDPYSIKKGFWYAHIGWLLFWRHYINFDNAKDLQKNPMIMNQFHYYLAWAFGAGVVLPLIIGAMTGHMLGAFIFSVCTRITLVYHCTFFINSICHMFGKATYDIHASAKDHWFIALLTYGEGYHNFHHRFPGDYRNGVRWFDWDPSKWTIAVLSFLGLASDLKRISKFRILAARLAAESKRKHIDLSQLSGGQHLKKCLDALRDKHENLQKNLITWERAARAYQVTIREQVSHRSHELRASALKNLQDARVRFQRAHEQWTGLVKLEPVDLSGFLLRTAS